MLAGRGLPAVLTPFWNMREVVRTVSSQASFPFSRRCFAVHSMPFSSHLSLGVKGSQGRALSLLFLCHRRTGIPGGEGAYRGHSAEEQQSQGHNSVRCTHPVQGVRPESPHISRISMHLSLTRTPVQTYIRGGGCAGNTAQGQVRK